jgi:hypothetical protein
MESYRCFDVNKTLILKRKLQSEMRYAFTDLIECLEATDSRSLGGVMGNNLP